MIKTKEPCYRGVGMPGDYESFSDAGLVQAIREDAPEAFAALSARYLRLIWAKARLFEGASVPEKEDLCQEGFLGLYVAATTYEETGGASFATYAGVCIYNRMASAVRRHASSGNRPLNESLSLDTAAATQMAAEKGPEVLVELREHFQSIQERMDMSLSPLERKVLALYLSGYRRSEIPEKAGISLKTFDNALQRVRSKLKNL